MHFHSYFIYLDFLVAFMLVSEKENLWIGLHDRINETVYTWDDGTPVTPDSYLNWEPNQPSFDDIENVCYCRASFLLI